VVTLTDPETGEVVVEPAWRDRVVVDRRRQVLAVLDAATSRVVPLSHFSVVAVGSADLAADGNHRARNRDRGGAGGAPGLGTSWREAVTAVLGRGVTGPGRRYHDVGAATFHLMTTTSLGAEETADEVLAWWRRTRGGASKLAARSWAASERMVRADALGYARKLEAARERGEVGRGARGDAWRFLEPVTAHERRRVAERVRAMGKIGIKWAGAVLAAAEHVLPRSRLPVRVHHTLWIGWAGGDKRRYQELRQVACTALGMARVGRWKVGVTAQQWLVTWRLAAGQVDLGELAVEVAGRELLVTPGGRCRWRRGRDPDDPDDDRVRLDELARLMARPRPEVVEDPAGAARVQEVLAIFESLGMPMVLVETRAFT